MDNKTISDKMKRVRIGMYSSSQGISTLALMIVAVFEILMLGYTLINPGLYGPYILRYRLFYFSLLLVAVVYVVLINFAKKDIENRFAIFEIANPACAVFFFIWALCITYSDALVTKIADPAVFMTFSMVAPLSFTLMPAVYALIVIAADTLMLYLLISINGASAALINIFIFFVFQFVLGIGFLRLKMNLAERIVQEEENARIDVMTGLPNRRVYEEDLKQLNERPLPDDLHYVVIDINGLKDINDSYGHDIGDKLIIGASRCIEHCFVGYGKPYRIGGDEFVVMLLTTKEKVDQLICDVGNSTKKWSEENGIALSVSCGCAGSEEYPGCAIVKLIKEADDRMYEEKEQYYKSIGKDRRRYRIKTEEPV